MDGRLLFRRTVVSGVGLLALVLPSALAVHAQQRASVADLLRQFEKETVFWRGLEIAKDIVAAKDASVLPKLEPRLTDPDRRARGNAALIFGGLGDPRGFDTIVAILNDRSEDRAVTEIASTGQQSPRAQIRADRYYAAHLLGDLKDPRGVPVLLPLMTDRDINYIVPWSLGQIGDRSAVPTLIDTLSVPDVNMRVLAIYALVDLKATDSLPRLRELLSDNTKSTFGNQDSVAEAARAAISKLEQ